MACALYWSVTAPPGHLPAHARRTRRPYPRSCRPSDGWRSGPVWYPARRFRNLGGKLTRRRVAHGGIVTAMVGTALQSLVLAQPAPPRDRGMARGKCGLVGVNSAESSPPPSVSRLVVFLNVGKDRRSPIRPQITNFRRHHQPKSKLSPQNRAFLTIHPLKNSELTTKNPIFQLQFPNSPPSSASKSQFSPQSS